ncbi:MAG: FtsX-like permease family protein [Treponema sp.]|nr:FtsX-like permease family protein [Treponema sp.]
MKKTDLGLLALSLKNLRAKPVRTACLVVVAAILALTLFGGSILVFNLRQGLSVMTQRFGADLMVVPQGSGGQAEALLLRGENSIFYFDASIVDNLTQTRGIVYASPQFFLTSLSDSVCCDAPFQLIAFDPITDFVIQPWISEKFSGQISDGQLIIGSRIIQRPSGTIMLFGHEYPVAARLSDSASGFDTSIFMTMNTMQHLIGRGHAEGYDFPADRYEGEVISAILVQTDPEIEQSFIVHDIQVQNQNVDVLVSSSIFSSITAALSGLQRYIQIFSAALWALAIVVLTAVFSGIIHERKKEFALLRILGATKKHLAGIVLSESLTAGLIGSVVGIFLASLTVFPFSALISTRLDLPYLDASFVQIITLALGSLLLSSIVGPLASLYSAIRISNAETYFTMREGE